MGQDNWCSPDYIVSSVISFFGGIGLDPADNPCSLTNAEISWYGPHAEIHAVDALDQDWAQTLYSCNSKTVYCNPPYSKKAGTKGHLYLFTDKMAKEAAKGVEIIALTKFDHSTDWFKDNVLPTFGALCLLFKRVRHIPPPGQPSHTPNFPSCLIYWGNRELEFCQKFQDLGFCLGPKSPRARL